MPPVGAAAIRALLIEIYAQKLERRHVSAADIDDSYDLLREGIIDSLGILEMINALEERLGVTLSFESLDVNQLTQVGPLSRHIEEQLVGQPVHPARVVA